MGGTPALPSAWARAGGQVSSFPSRRRLWLPSYLGSGGGAQKGLELGASLAKISGLNKWPEEGINSNMSDLCRNERVRDRRAFG